MSEQLRFDAAYKELTNTAYGLFVSIKTAEPLIQKQLSRSGTVEAARTHLAAVREKLGDVVALIEAVDKAIEAEAGKSKPLRRGPSVHGGENAYSSTQSGTKKRHEGVQTMRGIFLLPTGLAAGVLIWCVTASMTAQEPARGAVPKVGEFSSVKIDKRGVPSALDFHLDGKGRAIRFYQTVKGDPRPNDPPTYFNDAGMLYTRGWIVISGTTSGKGEGYNIEHPTKDPSMLAVWSDVLGPAIQVRAANAGADSYLFQGLDRKANYTFSVEQDGGLRWGAASRADMDTNLYRGAPKTLKTDGSLVIGTKVAIGGPGPASALHIGGSQSVQRTAVGADYAVTDADYYLGVTDTTMRRTVTLPTASGKTGRVYVIKDESGGAERNSIAVKAQPGETIDGAGSLPIGTNYGVLRVISNGKSWFGM